MIIPKNYGLFSVNVFVAFTSSAQLIRAYMFHRNKEQELKAQVAADAGPVAVTVSKEVVKAE